MPTYKWAELLFLTYLILFLDSGFPATQTPLATQGSIAPQGSIPTQGPTATQGSTVTSTPEPPLFQNFTGYHIGVGRADCTGQVADINLVGKSWASQRGCETNHFIIFSFFMYSWLLHNYLLTFLLISLLSKMMNIVLWGKGTFCSTTTLL